MLEFLYPISALYFYRLISMGWMILGESLFLFRMEKKSHFVWRSLGAVSACFLFAFLFPIPAVLASNAFYSMGMFIAFFLFTFLAARFVFAENWKLLFFACICGYTIEHIAYELYFAFSNFFMSDDAFRGDMYNVNGVTMFRDAFDELFYFFSYILTYWLVFIAFAFRFRPKETAITRGALKVLAVGTLFLFVDIVVNCLALFYASIHYEKVYMAILAMLNVLTCVLGLFYLFQMFYSNHIKREYEIMSEIRRKEKDQYELSRQTIDLINIKCHDLRHQIRKIGSEENISATTLHNISKLVNIYDSTIKTSNSTLNIILSEKSLFCTKEGIRFSCIADGSLLDFMAEEDIYSLFGNIIDNAIEAVTKLGEDKKIIRLKIVRMGNMISISEKNYFEGDIRMEHGRPLTSKKDTVHHGYGWKSIDMVVEKYHGTLSVTAEKNTFSVTILFVDPNGKKKS